MAFATAPQQLYLGDTWGTFAPSAVASYHQAAYPAAAYTTAAYPAPVSTTALPFVSTVSASYPVGTAAWLGQPLVQPATHAFPLYTTVAEAAPAAQFVTPEFVPTHNRNLTPLPASPKSLRRKPAWPSQIPAFNGRIGGPIGAHVDRK